MGIDDTPVYRVVTRSKMGKVMSRTFDYVVMYGTKRNQKKKKGGLQKPRDHICYLGAEGRTNAMRLIGQLGEDYNPFYVLLDSGASKSFVSGTY